ncbi:hypothetical protein CDAR_195781 [Caerostris darwini]|uniref:Uncharacterized protein n=1 Tax=Caerostris darwini TaxID=1538125 RepID=A0AAV4RZM0_9ARAC|nr:hypothetical protein CDAR_195781 [Caerostris darwini]
MIWITKSRRKQSVDEGIQPIDDGNVLLKCLRTANPKRWCYMSRFTFAVTSDKLERTHSRKIRYFAVVMCDVKRYDSTKLGTVRFIVGFFSARKYRLHLMNTPSLNSTQVGKFTSRALCC